MAIAEAKKAQQKFKECMEKAQEMANIVTKGLKESKAKHGDEGAKWHKKHEKTVDLLDMYCGDRRKFRELKKKGFFDGSGDERQNKP